MDKDKSLTDWDLTTPVFQALFLCLVDALLCAELGKPLRASLKAEPTFSFASVLLKARESTLCFCTVLTVPCPCLVQNCGLRGCSQDCEWNTAGLSLTLGKGRGACFRCEVGDIKAVGLVFVQRSMLCMCHLSLSHTLCGTDT